MPQRVEFLESCKMKHLTPFMSSSSPNPPPTPKLEKLESVKNHLFCKTYKLSHAGLNAANRGLAAS
jgi:hypothetical protein